MEVDVVMCTWNSNKPYFAKCLDRIKDEVPLHHFILIDRFSDDGTVEKVKQVFPNAIVKQTIESLGVARKRGIELVDTEFFVFMDSDIGLCKDWFKYVMGYVDSLTGGVQGRMLPTLIHLRKWIIWSRNLEERFKTTFKQNVLVATSKNPDIVRGSTHNTLIRTHLVRDWDPPKIISAFEDHLLLRHVVAKGYVWKIISKPLVYHYEALNLREWIGKARWHMAGARLIGYDDFSLRSLLTALPKGIMNASFASIWTKDPALLPCLAVVRLAYIQGWVGWSRFLEMRRAP